MLAVVSAFSHGQMIKWTETAIHWKLYPKGRTEAEKKAYQNEQRALHQAQKRWGTNLVISRCNQGDKGACQQLQALEGMCRDGDRSNCESLQGSRRP